MRHGQADNNVRRILVGRYKESHLTEVGKLQVRETAEFLKAMSIDKIISSPVTRTRETADIVSKILNLDYEIDERLYEIELGSMAGMNYDDLIQQHGDIFMKFYNGDNSLLSQFGIEPFTSVKQRVKHILDDIKDNYSNKNILLVTHLDPIKAAISNILDLDPTALYNWYMRNAALTILKNQEGIWSLSGVNLMHGNRYLDD